MSKLNGLKRMSQSFKRRTVSFCKNIGEGFANIPIRKRGNSLVVNRKSVSNIGDFVDVAKDNVESAQEDMLEDARKAIDEAQKFNVASAIKVLEEAGVSESEKRKVIKKLKEYFQKEGNKLTLFIRKKFGSLNKDVKELEKEEKSAESKKDFNQMLKNNGKTNKLSNNSPVTECMEIFTEDLPKTTKEGQNKTTAVLNKLGAGTTQLIADAIARASNSVRKEIAILKKEYEKKTVEFSKILDDEIKKCKVEETTLSPGEQGVVVNGKVCKNVKQFIKTVKDVITDQGADLVELLKVLYKKGFDPAFAAGAELMKNSTALFGDDKEAEEAIEAYKKTILSEDISSASNELGVLINEFGKSATKVINDALKHYKEHDEDFKKLKNGEDLKYSSTINILIRVISENTKKKKSCLENDIPNKVNEIMGKLRKNFSNFVEERGKQIK